MFESTKPISSAQSAPFAGADQRAGDVVIGRKDGGSASISGGALRMIEWNELTARLNAARDLRQLLKRDDSLGLSAASGSFADAAARYFRTREEGERDVNPNTLEPSKCSLGIAHEHDAPHPPEARNQGNANPGPAARGDARED